MGEDHEIDKRDDESLRGRKPRSGLRLVAAIVAIVLIAFGVSKAISFRNHLHNKMRAHGCIDNLHELGLICTMWKNDHDDAWPRLSDVPGEFMFDPDALTDYLSKPSLLRCPRDLSAPPSDEFPGDAFYIYLGPGLETEEEALAFLDAYLEAARAGEPLPSPEFDAQAFSIHDEDTYRRLSEMPVAFDRPKNHNYESINVLDANGNVQFRKMGTTYPATKAFWDKLAEVEAEIENIGRLPGAGGQTAQTDAQ
jgi:hypothetical protein